MRLEEQLDVFMEGFFESFRIKEWMLDEEDRALLEDIVFQIAASVYDENCNPRVPNIYLKPMETREDLRDFMVHYHLLFEDAFADAFEDHSIFNWFNKLIELFPETWESIQEDTAFIEKIGFYDLKSWDEVNARRETLEAEYC